VARLATREATPREAVCRGPGWRGRVRPHAQGSAGDGRCWRQCFGPLVLPPLPHPVIRGELTPSRRLSPPISQLPLPFQSSVLSSSFSCGPGDLAVTARVVVVVRLLRRRPWSVAEVFQLVSVSTPVRVGSSLSWSSGAGLLLRHGLTV
jgi:hypothetical protein